MKHIVLILLLMLMASAQAADLFLPAERAVAEQGPRSIYTLVDFRPSGDFLRLSIPHSLNIPLAALESMPHLRDRRLVLVGTGHGLTEPCATAETLRGRGWRIQILAGGLPGWKDAGGALTGDLFVLDACREISWNMFKSDARLTPLALAAVDGLTPEAEAVLNATGVCIFEPEDGETRQSFLLRMAGASVPVCLADADDRFPHRLIRDARQAGLQGFFILRGGMAAIRPASPEPCFPCDERKN